MPNLALYAGALKVIAPEKKPEKGQGKPTEEMPTTEASERELEIDTEPTRAPRAVVSKSFLK